MPNSEPRGQVIDLMAALRDSLGKMLCTCGHRSDAHPSRTDAWHPVRRCTVDGCACGNFTREATYAE